MRESEIQTMKACERCAHAAFSTSVDCLTDGFWIVVDDGVHTSQIDAESNLAPPLGRGAQHG